MKIEKREFENIGTWMKPVKETNLPDVLKGVFFMDGNPLPDDCINMYNLDWDADNKTLFLPVFGKNQWTFHTSILGIILLIGAWLVRFTYKIEFEDEQLTRSRVIPLVFGIKVPKWMINATMCRDENSQNGDIWERKNLWFGTITRLGDYTLRRVVNEDGTQTPAFKDMLSKVGKECLIVAPKCSVNTEENIKITAKSTN